MKVTNPERTPVTITKTLVCSNPDCQKRDVYRTYEIHEARYQRLLSIETGSPPINPDIIPRLPISSTPVVEHSFERALTPVEPVEPEPFNPLALEVAQNKAYKVIKAKLDNGEMTTEDYDKAMRTIFGD
jgi:hypothetical protein